NPDGRANFAATTDRIEVAVLKTYGTDGDDGEGPLRRSAAPGIGELTVIGAEDLLAPVRPETAFTVPCCSGPPGTIDGFTYDTSVSGTLADVIGHRPLALGTCRDLTEGLDLNAGPHELTTEPSATFVVQDLWLSRDPGPAARQRTLTVTQ